MMRENVGEMPVVGRGADGGMMVMRKGPWMAEEDEILMEYVRKHGPRDWSSIRSKGLLPRTGKSCRLRWVNKLKPDLKTGCKFSSEEEQTVIDLQARFGNKWARIATYLPGRTDNDVKNFWSTRQKRLARILQLPMPTKSSVNSRKLPVSHEIATSEDPCQNVPLFEGESSNGQCSGASLHMEGQDGRKMDTTPPLLGPVAGVTPFMSESLLHFDHLPDPLLLDLPPLVDVSFPDDFVCQEASRFFRLDTVQHCVKGGGEHLRTPESFFDDLPVDMFDYLEPQPSSASW